MSTEKNHLRALILASAPSLFDNGGEDRERFFRAFAATILLHRLGEPLPRLVNGERTVLKCFKKVLGIIPEKQRKKALSDLELWLIELIYNRQK